ncbi:hypothetical protein BH23CHL4_BH23CHL4_23980 [soil metagenome]
MNLAGMFLGRSWLTIESRKMLPEGVLPDRPKRKLDPELIVEPGLALCSYKDTGWGDLVRKCKYETGRFDDRLVDAAREAILATWEVECMGWWITAVPSLRSPELVAGFAERLAGALQIPFSPALIKTKETAEQKLMQNSAQQVENIMTAFRANASLVRPGPVILVDDMVDSGWTVTTCGARLLRSGSGPVHPFALASFRRGV